MRGKEHRREHRKRPGRLDSGAARPDLYREGANRFANGDNAFCIPTA